MSSLDIRDTLRYGQYMRVISGLVLAGWLASGIVLPCFAWNRCATTTRETCCCGGVTDCCCRLSAAGSSAASVNVADLPTARNPKSLPAVQVSATAGAGVAAAASDGAFELDLANPGSPPSYLSARAVRC